MGQPVVEIQLKPESSVDIKRSCKEDILHYPDPTLHLQLQLQLAIANDDFTTAAQYVLFIWNLIASQTMSVLWRC